MIWWKCEWWRNKTNRKFMQARKSARIFKLTIHGFTSFMIVCIIQCIVLRLDGGLVKWLVCCVCSWIANYSPPKNSRANKNLQHFAENTSHSNYIKNCMLLFSFFNILTYYYFFWINKHDYYLVIRLPNKKGEKIGFVEFVVLREENYKNCCLFQQKKKKWIDDKRVNWKEPKKSEPKES